MALFIIIVTDNLAQVFINFSKRLVTLVSSKKIGCNNPSQWDKASNSGSTRATIIIVFFIALIVPIVFLRLVKSLGDFEVLRKLGSKLLWFWFLAPEQILIRAFLLYIFIRLGGSMVLGTLSIHFLDSRQKIKSGFGFRGNSFSDGLFPDVFLAIILIGLGTDEWL